ncbi:hypothetical protein K443DRAFT_133553 [Laccaria amethystina LaAM-08-1]|uniref:Uncharacterized protein n=1 Tax=Laccaria amethystina LaAM-08-1 TaxID=1095629 RepID=A0A0C9WZ74_9AGAR|nr:hypothetical protein K443DRAFT_133553 [Laccaria amethystina LaAM-08-1]
MGSHLTTLKIASGKIIVNLTRIFNKLIDLRCFPHIVNLACKAVIAALARSDYGSTTGDHTDPISTLHALVRAVRASSLRCQHFSEICEKYDLDLQLLRDVTRWSSTLYMIERALHLEKPLDNICSSGEFQDLEKYKLSSEEWDGLAAAQEILMVLEAFQQKLSAEKTPTLCNALPAFDTMVSVWNELQESMDELYFDIIQAGIDKLDAYHNRAELVPAYMISMCELSFLIMLQMIY